MTSFSELLKLYGEIFYIGFYPIMVLMLVIRLQLGVLSWLVIGAFLAPPTVVWYVVVRRRIIKYLKILLDNKPRPWDIEKAVREYKALLEKEKKT
jgi:hypothetical protein